MPLWAVLRVDADGFGAGGGAGCAGQYHRDSGALAELAFDLNGAAGLMREAINLRQTQPRSLADRLGGEERIEHVAHDVGRNANAAICNGDADVVA